MEHCGKLQGAQESGFPILKVFEILNENGHFNAMKTLKEYVPKDDYENAFNHLSEGIGAEQLNIPNIPNEKLEKCCRGYVNFLAKFFH